MIEHFLKSRGSGEMPTNSDGDSASPAETSGSEKREERLEPLSGALEDFCKALVRRAAEDGRRRALQRTK